MSFLDDHKLLIPFSKQLIVYGSTSKDIFVSLWSILKSIVHNELSESGNLNLQNVSDSDVEMLQSKMLEFGINLFIERKPGTFDQKNHESSRLRDYCVILGGKDSYVKISFDYASFNSSPRHLE